MKKSIATLGSLKLATTSINSEQTIQKSEQDEALETLMNPDLIKAKQGLVKKVITNSKGRKQTVWVKAGEKQKQSKASKEKDKSEMSKIKMSKEIMDGMKFLGIPSEKFSELKEEKGGTKQLHEYIAGELSGEKKSDIDKPKIGENYGAGEILNLIKESYEEKHLQSMNSPELRSTRDQAQKLIAGKVSLALEQRLIKWKEGAKKAIAASKKKK